MEQIYWVHGVHRAPGSTIEFSRLYHRFFFRREISLIESQMTSTIDIKEKQDTIKQV